MNTKEKAAEVRKMVQGMKDRLIEGGSEIVPNNLVKAFGVKDKDAYYGAALSTINGILADTDDTLAVMHAQAAVRRVMNERLKWEINKSGFSFLYKD